MTNGNGTAAPSAIAGDTYEWPMYGGVPLGIAIPYLASAPGYSDLPFYWTWQRDLMLAQTMHKENMWSGAVSKVATKFAAHGFTIKDSEDSKRRVEQSQKLFKQADGGQGWVVFATKVARNVILHDNGTFIGIRHADDETVSVRTKAYTPNYLDQDQAYTQVEMVSSSPGARITGLYSLSSLRCTRTGNLAFPVRYQPLTGPARLLRWDQVLYYADQSSSEPELCGVGLSATSRCYLTIATLAALRQMLHEFIAGKGATKLAFLQGIGEPTLKSVIKAGEFDAQAKGFIYYLGTILGAIPSDTPISLVEVLLKQLPPGFDPKFIIDDAYLTYANNLGVSVQDIKPLTGQFGAGTQSIILEEAAGGSGMLPAFLKWWEQTASDRILPATTELSFDDENDLRDQKARADVRLIRAQERAARIQSGEITPAIARQLAADDKDLPQELLAADATPGGQISDDEKPDANDQTSPAALDLMQGLSAAPPALPGAAPVVKSFDALYQAELSIARSLAKWSEV